MPNEIMEGRNGAVVSSALWAAAGDALGWITELGNEGTVIHRTGTDFVRFPVEWRRRIGGRYGPTVALPSGTYSDDTQVRLAVSRAIGANGEFDVEAFSKVELPVWLSYSLGAGRGTSSAASNLSKAAVSWFSNYFGGSDGRGYLSAGGNGAAMRIQPHVWNGRRSGRFAFETDVFRDAIVTHGHPQGFCGALFHAHCLNHALCTGELPTPDDWLEYLDRLASLPALARDDEKLGLFWLGPWEERSGRTLHVAVSQEANRARALLLRLRSEMDRGFERYGQVLEIMGATRDETRGAGLFSAISAAALAWLGRYSSTEEILVVGANAIGSDTDTICTMAGAIVGAARPSRPEWAIQDRDYIVSEALRISSLGEDGGSGSFRYPDLMSWVPPGTQSDAVGEFGGDVCVAGLGRAEPFGEVWTTSEAEWQWLRLSFGQTVLAKRRPTLPNLTEADLPAPEGKSQRPLALAPDVQPALFKSTQSGSRRTHRDTSSIRSSARFAGGTYGLDELTDWVIRDNFDPATIGRAFLIATEGPDGVERSVAFSSIVSKAILTRKRRQGR